MIQSVHLEKAFWHRYRSALSVFKEPCRMYVLPSLHKAYEIYMSYNEIAPNV